MGISREEGEVNFEEPWGDGFTRHLAMAEISPPDESLLEPLDVKRINSLEYLRPYAEKGDHRALHAMGMIRYNEAQISRDFTIAANLFCNASLQGNCRSQYNLASLYISRGKKGDWSKGANLAYCSAKQGFNPGCVLLGCCFMEGIGVDQIKSTGMLWFERAAKRGDVEAQRFLASAYLDYTDLSGDIDPQKIVCGISAYVWASIAVSSGCQDSESVILKSKEFLGKLDNSFLGLVETTLKNKKEIVKKGALLYGKLYGPSDTTYMPTGDFVTLDGFEDCGSIIDNYKEALENFRETSSLPDKDFAMLVPKPHSYCRFFPGANLENLEESLPTSDLHLSKERTDQRYFWRLYVNSSLSMDKKMIFMVYVVLPDGRGVLGHRFGIEQSSGS